MLGTLAQFAGRIRRPALAAVATAAMVLPALPTSSLARGPDNIADIAERVIDAVVNISTSQKVETRNTPMPQMPNDPQLDELFRDFFNRLLEERVGMRPESRDALDVSNGVIPMNAESLKSQGALITGATGGTKARVAQ